ncbi:MAG TPA: beta-ketoacyl synthase N-terminal-like domain-containing protein [Syntrophomonadaceae bacterium]|nr:beta-ketoacyl synthase N-terminal-like domain-containing protein [Syntrophomonadaceae bacterium]
MRRVAVIGTGHSKFCFNSPKTSVEMLAEVAIDAINEAHVTPKDIQAINVGNVLGDFEEGQGMVQSFFANDIGCFGVPASRFEGACASGSMAVRDAVMWVASGYYDIMLVGGVEKCTAMGTNLATRTFAMFGDSRYEYPAGFTFPAVFALLAHLYSDKYGIPLQELKEQMASVSVQSHEYALMNPRAQIQKTISKEDVLKSFMVSTPIQLQDACPFSDGAAAIVIASEEVAKKLISKPVYFAGIGQSSSGKLSSQYKFLPRLRARELACQQSYSMAGLTPKDIDVVELHDCFSIAAMIAAEGLGFFEYGTAGAAWEKGETRQGGTTPINLSGGLKAKGHPIGATGLSQVCEITYQLRGDLVDQGRQVEGAQYGLIDTLGGDGVLISLILSGK